jgi:dihydrodipicolinate synthase/N-acetylneuraminate lyase
VEAKRLLEVFLPLEAIRERHNAIRVLHTAVSLSGVADMGPILPLLTEADPATHGEIKEAARALLAAEMTARQQAAAA